MRKKTMAAAPCLRTTHYALRNRKPDEPSLRPPRLRPQLADLELDLPPRRAARPAHAGDGDHEQRLPPPPPRGGAQERHPPVVHLVHGRPDVLPLPSRDRQRGAADVLLPPGHRVRL